MKMGVVRIGWLFLELFGQFGALFGTGIFQGFHVFAGIGLLKEVLLGVLNEFVLFQPSRCASGFGNG